MRDYTDRRDGDSADELWLVEHPGVYTLGRAGERRHLLAESTIPLVESDRGGQITYHAPGQLVVYTLLDLGRLRQGVRWLVDALESSVIELLATFSIVAWSRRDAPGVYCDQGKIASLGLRVRRHCSYHGLALNVDLDLSPFAAINPCGMAGLAVTRTSDLGGPVTVSEAAKVLLPALVGTLGFSGWHEASMDDDRLLNGSLRHLPSLDIGREMRGGGR
jgi:lipoyl(octanoyl) transferase